MTVTSTVAAIQPAAPIASSLVAWVRATRSELRRLLRPGFAGIAALLVAAFAVMASTVTFQGDFAGPALNRVPIDLESSRGLVAGLSNVTSLLGIITLSLWAVAAASDFGTGWIRVMVQAEPRRGVLLAGKITALVALTLGLTLLATVVSVASAPPMASAAGISTDAWFTDLPATLLSGWGNLSLAVLVWGVIGLAVGIVARSSVVAIAGGIGYLIVFEGMLGQLAPDATTWLPGSVLGVLSGGGSPGMAWGTSLAVAVGYAAIGVVIAAISFIRRDITA